MKHDIVLTVPIYATAVEQLDQNFTVHRLWQAKHRSAFFAEIRDRVRAIATGGYPINAELMDELPKTEIIATQSVGVDHIDLAAARARGIAVTNTPDVLTDATADLTIALIMDITRRISEGDRLIRRGGWKEWSLDLMVGKELRGKTLGIIGFGRIGQAVAARAPAFGMRVAYTGRGPKSGASGENMPLDRLLSTSDVVSVHCPLTPETKHLINQTTLARKIGRAHV